MGAENRNDLEEEFLADKAAKDGFALFWRAMVGLEMKAFPYFQE